MTTAAAVKTTSSATTSAEADEGEERQLGYHSIDDLQLHGINVGDITKLKAAGCHTVESVLMRTRKDLINVKGISEQKVEKLLEAAAKIRSISFITGSELYHRSSALDTLLKGGIESMGITEVFGEFRTGKTQLCHTVAVTAMLPRSMEGTFRPERIEKIAARFNLNPEVVLDNVLYARAYTHEQQMDLLTEVAARMVEEKFALLVVDSVTALFRVDFTGSSEEFNIAVLMSNQVCADPGAGAMFVADPKKPIGGHVLAHASTTRLFLRKGKGEQRICKVYDSPCLPEEEAIFTISEGGIIDSKE
ncbi:meiotic recombinase Dmc1 protein [Pelomyxa schiedti]|nr:meiotic recombinase Dmc1 protein [Pelomyxa schiedti]